MNTQKTSEKILFSVLMALGMSFFMAAAMVIVKVGFTPAFLKTFFQEWALGFVISVLPSFLLPILITKILGKFRKKGLLNKGINSAFGQ